MHTKFGRTAELVRTAYVVSTQQKAVFRVVRNLAGFNGAVTVGLMIYAYAIGNVARRGRSAGADFGSRLGAGGAAGDVHSGHRHRPQALTKVGVLPTRLSAVDEAASMDVLCMDKTGTLTRNELAVAAVHTMPGFDEGHVLALAALASADGGQDPGRCRRGAPRRRAAPSPACRNSRNSYRSIRRPRCRRRAPVDDAGTTLRIVKGAFSSSRASRRPRPTPKKSPMSWKRKATAFSASRSDRKARCASPASWR